MQYHRDGKHFYIAAITNIVEPVPKALRVPIPSQKFRKDLFDLVVRIHSTGGAFLAPVDEHRTLATFVSAFDLMGESYLSQILSLDWLIPYPDLEPPQDWPHLDTECLFIARATICLLVNTPEAQKKLITLFLTTELRIDLSPDILHDLWELASILDRAEFVDGELAPHARLGVMMFLNPIDGVSTESTYYSPFLAAYDHLGSPGMVALLEQGLNPTLKMGIPIVDAILFHYPDTPAAKLARRCASYFRDGVAEMLEKDPDETLADVSDVADLLLYLGRRLLHLHQATGFHGIIETLGTVGEEYLKSQDMFGRTLLHLALGYDLLYAAEELRRVLGAQFFEALAITDCLGLTPVDYIYLADSKRVRNAFFTPEIPKGIQRDVHLLDFHDEDLTAVYSAAQAGIAAVAEQLAQGNNPIEAMRTILALLPEIMAHYQKERDPEVTTKQIVRQLVDGTIQAPQLISHFVSICQLPEQKIQRKPLRSEPDPTIHSEPKPEPEPKPKPELESEPEPESEPKSEQLQQVPELQLPSSPQPIPEPIPKPKPEPQQETTQPLTKEERDRNHTLARLFGKVIATTDVDVERIVIPIPIVMSVAEIMQRMGQLPLCATLEDSATKNGIICLETLKELQRLLGS